jgi:predicted DNA-binding protein
MSLVKKPEMTEKNLAAHRANGAHSHGAVTPGGKANSAASNLRHGFYCQAPNRALTALGEDPEEYAGLMNSLENNLAEGLEAELVQRLGDTLWRMKRAARMRDGLALKRLRAAQEIQQTTTMAQRPLLHENLERYDDLASALRRRGNGPTPAEIQTFVKYVGNDPSEEMEEFLLLLKSLSKLEDGRERKAARRKVRVQLKELQESYRRVCVRIAEQLEEMQSPENLAALTAPQDEKSLLMQRMEDSSLRQL